MENTKEILEWQKNRAQSEILKLAEKVKAEGMSKDVIFQCYMIRDVIEELNAADHFFNAWHPEGEQSKRRLELNGDE